MIQFNNDTFNLSVNTTSTMLFPTLGRRTLQEIYELLDTNSRNLFHDFSLVVTTGVNYVLLRTVIVIRGAI